MLILTLKVIHCCHHQSAKNGDENRKNFFATQFRTLNIFQIVLKYCCTEFHRLYVFKKIWLKMLVLTP